MIRRPLRPLARVLNARLKGENPDDVEAEERAARLRKLQKAERQRAETRLLLVGVLFLMGFGAVGGRMAMLAASEPVEPTSAGNQPIITMQRADIVDRNGNILATNLATDALYAQPREMVDPRAAATGLAGIFPDMDAEKLLEDFTGTRKFLWLKRTISPEQHQAVHDLGEPGLLFGPREIRLYPNGKIAAHVLGGAGFGREGVHAAEVIGKAGVESKFDAFLRDPAEEGEPLELSLDLSVQSAVETVLAGGMRLMNAKGASAVLMDVHTGELISLASLPDFDPNQRPLPPVTGDPADSPLFNRVVQGRYELGSTFKIFTAAMALESGLATPNTMIDTQGPLKWGKFTIRDFHDYGKTLSLTDVIVKSSNIGTARMAQEMGIEPQQAFLRSLGFFDPLPIELTEAGRSKPLLPPRWSELSTMTISYGHGLAASPLHLATAYSTVVNGGVRVVPTILKREEPRAGAARILSEATSEEVTKMLRSVVSRGTASMADVPGYSVGGKTGTADKPHPNGGYYEDKVITTFAATFPTNEPKYVLIVTLDEPEIEDGTEARRTAGWTAAPVAAEIIRRIAPLMNMRPENMERDSQAISMALARN